MKNDKLRMNIDYTINIVFAALYALGGLICIVLCISLAAFIGGGFELLDFDSEYSRVFSIFLGLFLVAAYVMIFGAMIVIGLIPAMIGVVICALSSLARFAYTEHGTVITKPYKILMTAAYIVSTAVTVFYIAGAGSIILMGLLSNCS